MELIDALHADGFTIVVISHDANVAARANRTVAIKDGLLSEPPPVPARAGPACLASVLRLPVRRAAGPP